jgi:hypothetical protein
MPHDFLQVLSSTFVVIARFMRATQFPSLRKEKWVARTVRSDSVRTGNDNCF